MGFDLGEIFQSINRIRLEFKVITLFFAILRVSGINRIRLEFKGANDAARRPILRCINRIRLEFKVCVRIMVFSIESSINRIRLEFKAGSCDVACTGRIEY